MSSLEERVVVAVLLVTIGAMTVAVLVRGRRGQKEAAKNEVVAPHREQRLRDGGGGDDDERGLTRLSVSTCSCIRNQSGDARDSATDYGRCET